MNRLRENPFHVISEREGELIALIIKGLSRIEIAEKMGITKNTYDSYRKNIREKLNIRNQADWAKVLMEFENKL